MEEFQKVSHLISVSIKISCQVLPYNVIVTVRLLFLYTLAKFVTKDLSKTMLTFNLSKETRCNCVELI